MKLGCQAIHTGTPNLAFGDCLALSLPPTTGSAQSKAYLPALIRSSYRPIRGPTSSPSGPEFLRRASNPEPAHAPRLPPKVV
jgi:hypothetical protein